MRKDSTKRAGGVKQSAIKPLSDEEIKHLAKTVCAYGDDALSHSQAFLILMDTIARRPNHADSIAFTCRSIAFARCSDEDDQMVVAEVELLRDEIQLAT